ncbi:thermonuclease family protein [Fusobacterium ulcerans]|jgi:micrococcal nuclease|uniref:thermonuclease family protein n=1 Tax=Fusobacterium ulcerans TaxID=861 RepID=UPI000E49B2A3|nr:thermonuclease family protein [Fusobacterium ulcerans]RGY65361.1 thermonuclease family protein [Fusobacterium ulcerans]
MRKIMFAIFIFSLSIIAVAVSGKVIRVSDGDTILIQSGSQKIRVRMYGIDAPELKQKYGEESKKYLEKRIMDKNVDIKVINQDQYGRKVGKVFYKNKDINLEMLETGNAWFYEYHAKHEKDYRKAFKNAKEEKLGLWKDKNPQNPRNFRLDHRREG